MNVTCNKNVTILDNALVTDVPPPTTPAEEKRSEPEAAAEVSEKIPTDAADTTEPSGELIPQEIPSATG